MHLIGVVVALHGKETGAGDFMVLDVLEAGLAPQIEPQLKSSMILASIFVIFFSYLDQIYTYLSICCL
jgi:DNA polymerase delta subunit 2